MKAKISVTLSEALLTEVDKLAIAPYTRSAIIEEAVQQYLANIAQRERDQRELDTLNVNADDFNAENRRMIDTGHQLVGYSKFTSALLPRFATRNAGWVARSKGATVAVLKPPAPARMNQRSYVTTFWRPMPADRWVLGAIYDDLDPNVLGTVGSRSS